MPTKAEKGKTYGVCDRSQQKYIDNSEPGEGLLIFENVVLPFSNPIPKNTQLYKIMTTRLSEVVEL